MTFHKKYYLQSRLQNLQSVYIEYGIQSYESDMNSSLLTYT